MLCWEELIISSFLRCCLPHPPKQAPKFLYSISKKDFRKFRYGRPKTLYVCWAPAGEIGSMGKKVGFAAKQCATTHCETLHYPIFGGLLTPQHAI